MQYRKFGNLDWQASALGFGCMRFPETNETSSNNIDEPEAMRMLHYAIDHGVNYLDTAFPYHNGYSETIVGKALKVDNYRNKVKLATKLPCWDVEKYDDFDKLLNEQLQKLQVEHVDFYLLHALDRKNWDKVRKLDVLTWAEGALADGRIGHLGFSFHDSYEVFEEIVDAYNSWTFCQIQYNYMDIEHQAGKRGLQYAASKGLAVVIMEPLLGGRLANPPASIQTIWDSAARQCSAVGWSLHWLWNQSEVSTVLSGMSSMDQVKDNIHNAGASGVGHLNSDEMALIAKVHDKYLELRPVFCTGCNYCRPCAQGVNIPHIFKVYNDGLIHNDYHIAREQYKLWTPEKEYAKHCIACRTCENMCPQQIPISRWMPVIHNVLNEDMAYQTRLE
jgi:predicted aldo/keto reductase-like oxidoreductase